MEFSWQQAFWQNIFPVILTVLGMGGLATLLASWLQKRHEKFRVIEVNFQKSKNLLLKKLN